MQQDEHARPFGLIDRRRCGSGDPRRGDGVGGSSGAAAGEVGIGGEGTDDRPAGASPKRAAARSKRAWVASAVSGVFSDGFQMQLSPHTRASAAFHAQTATGKLKAEMIATGPSGCQLSIIRWPARSDAMVRP